MRREVLFDAIYAQLYGLNALQLSLLLQELSNLNNEKVPQKYPTQEASRR